MSEPLAPLEPLEPERYELEAAPFYRFDLDRREFVKAGGLVVLLVAAAPALGQDPRRRRGGAPPDDVGAWIHIGADGGVTVYTGKAEVGQDIRTSLAQAVADELHVPMAAVTMVMADTARTPYDRGTFGSQTTPRMAPQLRRAAAAARQLLLERAAAQWEVEATAISLDAGVLRHEASARSATFGELTEGQKLVHAIAARDETLPPERWAVAGTPVPKVNGRAIVTGAHRYASDIRRPKMLSGKVLRPPGFDAELTGCDASAAEAITGVTVVVDGTFVGVTARDDATADRALAALRPQWRRGERVSSATLFDDLRRTAGGARGEPVGSLDAGRAAAAVSLEQTYTVAYIAHVPLEPRAAIAEWNDNGTLTVWTGTQRPFGVRDEVAAALRVSADKVRVIVPDTGSGYGGKHSGEAAVEAARLARAAGRPVRVVWSRDEEFTWAYHRPAGVIDIRSGAAADGALTLWECDNYNSGGSALETPYAVPHRAVRFHRSDAPLRQGSYRALAATANCFARESHMDELAHALRQEPLAFRLQNLKEPRLRAVLEAAARRFGWPAKPTDGQGAGIACGTEKGGYVACCAAVSVDPDSRRLRVERIVTAFECGAIVNPQNLENQVEGAVIMGLGGALFEAIVFADGTITNPRLSSYRVPRFGDVPALETVLLDRRDLPSAGAGEAPLIAVAPAIANAIFAACGTRLRALPLVPDGVVPA